jgi:amino-acid N-acetyltransferase
MQAVVRKARMEDVKDIHALLQSAAGEGMLLPRSLAQLYSHLRDFFVMHDAGHDAGNVLIGCGALAIMWEGLAEIRSLLVAPACRSSGGGRLLVRACLDEARELGLRRVFALTYQVAFFERQGFSVAPKDVLPQKVWVDCIHCAKFPDCDETAVLLDLAP